MKIKTVYIGVLVALAVCGNAYAAPVNLGFESGLDGWTLGSTESYDVVHSYADSAGYTYSPALPTEASHFLTLINGSVSQTFTAAKGEAIIGTLRIMMQSGHRI